MMEVVGYFAAVFIGVSLGLIGGGGSILTVPVLVYLFHIEPVLATSYSLFIVGTSSLAGVFSKFKQGLVNVKTAVIFGIPSIIAVFVTRKFIVPLIPQEVFSIGDLVVTRNILLMLVFALLMIAASISMIRNTTIEKEKPRQAVQKFNYPLIFAEGLLVGALTGLVGAGGGFLIIPALVFLSKLPMKEAIATSLLIITAKSLIGFTGDLTNYKMNWQLLLVVTALAIAGILIGDGLSKKIAGERLKKGFGWFVLTMGAYIIVKELFFNNTA